MNTRPSHFNRNLIILLASLYLLTIAAFSYANWATALFTAFFVRDLAALPNLLLFVVPILMVALLFYADWQWLTPAQPPEINPSE